MSHLDCLCNESIMKIITHLSIDDVNSLAHTSKSVLSTIDNPYFWKNYLKLRYSDFNTRKDQDFIIQYMFNEKCIEKITQENLLINSIANFFFDHYGKKEHLATVHLNNIKQSYRRNSEVMSFVWNSFSSILEVVTNLSNQAKVKMIEKYPESERHTIEYLLTEDQRLLQEKTCYKKNVINEIENIIITQSSQYYVGYDNKFIIDRILSIMCDYNSFYPNAKEQLLICACEHDKSLLPVILKHIRIKENLLVIALKEKKLDVYQYFLPMFLEHNSISAHLAYQMFKTDHVELFDSFYEALPNDNFTTLKNLIEVAYPYKNLYCAQELYKFIRHLKIRFHQDLEDIISLKGLLLDLAIKNDQRYMICTLLEKYGDEYISEKLSFIIKMHKEQESYKNEKKYIFKNQYCIAQFIQQFIRYRPQSTQNLCEDDKLFLIRHSISDHFKSVESNDRRKHVNIEDTIDIIDKLVKSLKSHKCKNLLDGLKEIITNQCAVYSERYPDRSLMNDFEYFFESMYFVFDIVEIIMKYHNFVLLIKVSKQDYDKILNGGDQKLIDLFNKFTKHDE